MSKQKLYKNFKELEEFSIVFLGVSLMGVLN